MAFWSANRNVSVIKSALGLASNVFSKNSTLSGPILQVRTATKRAAGSRTNMKDSAGRHLGPKKNEGQQVEPGQIIMRQRGTKFFPGENVGIGKDHTIFALEPGFVRFYYDPFHPRRRFVGVALDQESRLPTPHFAPRARRFGYVPIEDPKKASIEETHLNRKQYLAKPKLDEDLKFREQKRAKTLSQYQKDLSQIIPELEAEQLNIASEHLLLVRNHLKNGSNDTEARSTAIAVHIQNLKLSLRKREINDSEFKNSLDSYQNLISRLEKEVSFDSKYNLIKFRSEEERITLVNELRSTIEEVLKSNSKDKLQKVKDLIFNSTVLTLSEAVKFKRTFAKSVLPESIGVSESVGKNSIVTKRWNYTKQRVEVIARTKEAFLSK
ncbi:60S ribosomal protein L2, mitochondrial [Wickerhamomyces ciferrii]|uniref:Large ribosomal subunit protein bL27m n=1 Tax=Wickerhamomyces ciferrii (strain ATCC 14091 / BCRC 22168 / CBS 111 / JCM 3599 / NBRC 0793 / NRRL Y-1031 F-60-10) TaxID=1206466 RepID=K0KII5_WICCF|nr:60S ribosomal protein L2, mitochondrial [Wickerhamomyces ciferrii]CCH42786.1 60S ribosomal protein L2, mitochondrial [Wickerhamomyces ciferrii]